MAIDSRDKRASCYCLALPFGRVGLTPDGSINAADRSQLNFLYRGVPGGTPVTATLVGTWLGSSRIDLHTESRYLDQ